MRTDTASPVLLSDYRVSDYLIDTVHLTFKLDRTKTRVISELALRPHPQGRASAPLYLDGENLTLISASVNDQPCDQAIANEHGFTLHNPPQKPFTLRIETEINPSANTELMGLFRSGAAYCTQCEAEGFRRITYFIDRPDVMAIYTTRIEADSADAPILLGNGNCVERGRLDDPQRHYAIWHDPFPKPSYLFALVAGDLENISDHFTTSSGRQVELGIYVEHGKGARATYAMDALKRSMAWDESVFGREYDLDVFNIVAVSDFNMGAMENKGLNIFNDKYVLASSHTATDTDYANIESVIAHEYFHNWTGNRITCRDWFQLCLKEGLTVFRDQEFSSDQRSRAVKRISDVRNLRASQFIEDAGPLAHNVRPRLYHEINNFYTSTIYDKGAEIIRMLKILIDDKHFAEAMTLYFDRFDGTAATIEDFISCFAEASKRDMTQFMRWYEQAGTPLVTLEGAWNARNHCFTLTCTQHTAPTPHQDVKEPFVIPMSLGLMNRDGKAFTLIPADATDTSMMDECRRGVFELKDKQRILTFASIPSRPVISAFRGFSAPVNIDIRASDDEIVSDLICLLAHDTDPFNKWQAAQSYANLLLRQASDAARAGQKPIKDQAYIDALRHALAHNHADPAFASLILTVPSENDIARDIGENVDPEAIHTARHFLRAEIGQGLLDLLQKLYTELSDQQPYSPDAASAGRRLLKNTALDLIACADAERGAQLALAQFKAAGNMTDRLAALTTLTLMKSPLSEPALTEFYTQWHDDPLVLDKWFALQASVADYATIDRIIALHKQHEQAMSNPNRLRALIGTFSLANPMAFHAPDGRGYKLLADIVREYDRRNPQIAARLLSAFRSWRTLEPHRRALALKELQAVASQNNLSVDVRDIVTRALH
jgi:aminopeptidase N